MGSEEEWGQEEWGQVSHCSIWLSPELFWEFPKNSAGMLLQQDASDGLVDLSGILDTVAEQ